MTARLIVCISGNGTNLQAIIDAIECGELNAQIVLVVSNRKAAFGLHRAEQARIPTLYFPLKPYTDANKSRTEYDRDLAERLLAYAPDLIVLAGWMHVFDKTFLDYFPKRVINLHPALPGQFAGLNAIERTYIGLKQGDVDAGGCMVHYVVSEIDAGEVIAQVTVPLQESDSLEGFAERVHSAEHVLLVNAIHTIIS